MRLKFRPRLGTLMAKSAATSEGCDVLDLLAEAAILEVDRDRVI